MAQLFINYRVEDSAQGAARLAADLKRCLASHEVFIDENNLKIGTERRVELEQAVDVSAAMLVLMGPEWSKILQERRDTLERVTDYVLMEIRRGLKKGVRIIPVLFDGATLPSQDLLRTFEVDAIRFNQCAHLHRRTWNADVERIVSDLRTLGFEANSPASTYATGSHLSMPDRVWCRDYGQRNGYLAANVLHLMAEGSGCLSDLDFSNVMIRQAFLRDLYIHNVNFNRCVFRETAFRQIWSLAVWCG